MPRFRIASIRNIRCCEMYWARSVRSRRAVCDFCCCGVNGVDPDSAAGRSERTRPAGASRSDGLATGGGTASGSVPAK